MDSQTGRGSNQKSWHVLYLLKSFESPNITHFLYMFSILEMISCIPQCFCNYVWTYKALLQLIPFVSISNVRCYSYLVRF